MAEDNTNTEIQLDDSLLVSDSNERVKQFDSKQLNQNEFISLAQERFLKERMSSFISNYLTKKKFYPIKQDLENKLKSLQKTYNIASSMRIGKLRVVDGQVILIEANSIPSGKSPLDHLYDNWEVPSNYVVNQIKGCFLRGTTYEYNHMDGSNQINVKDENLPSHMHQSSITTGMGINGIKQSSTKNEHESDGIKYDMFYDDSKSTGLTKNELDGIDGLFSIQEVGQDESSHNNIPVYHEFYAFEIRKIDS